MPLTERVWAAYRDEQARLTALECRESEIVAARDWSSTRYIRTGTRKKVVRRRLRRLELLLARAYARLRRKAPSAQGGV